MAKVVAWQVPHSVFIGWATIYKINAKFIMCFIVTLGLTKSTSVCTHWIGVIPIFIRWLLFCGTLCFTHVVFSVPIAPSYFTEVLTVGAVRLFFTMELMSQLPFSLFIFIYSIFSFIIATLFLGLYQLPEMLTSECAWKCG